MQTTTKSHGEWGGLYADMTSTYLKWNLQYLIVANSNVNYM